MTSEKNILDTNGLSVKIGSKIKIKIPMQNAYDTGKVISYDEECRSYVYVSRGKARWSNGKKYFAVEKGEQICFGEEDDFEIIKRYD